MACEFNNNFYLMSKISLVISHSETAEGKIIALLITVSTKEQLWLRPQAPVSNKFELNLFSEQPVLTKVFIQKNFIRQFSYKKF